MNTDATRPTSCSAITASRKPPRRGRPAHSPCDGPGATLRAGREAMGMTLRQVADRLSVSFVHLSDVELGKKGTSAEVLERWAKVLGLDPAPLLCAYRLVPERAADAFFDVDRMRAALAGGA